MNTHFCDGQGNCSGYLPGTKGIHAYLHDNIGAYRAWHHSGIRVPVHILVAFLTILLAGAVALGPRVADNPQAAVGIFAQLPFQGRLTNSDGTVVADGSYDAILKLYTVDTGGVAVWTESHTGANQITTTDGIFNALLGSITALTGIDFNQDEYWLGITVGADAEMTPRIRLGSAPYAFNTDKLDGVSGEAFFQLPGQAGGQIGYGGTAASENLVLRSTSHATKGDVIIADDGGLVGVGVADPFQTILGSVSITPATGIHIDGGLGTANIALEGNDPGLNFINYTAGANEKWTDIFQSTAGYLGFYSRDDSGALVQAVASPILSLNNTTGNIGLGTNAPTSFKLEVVGSVGPNIDDIYDLGSSSLRWRDLYLGPATLHIGTSASDEGTLTFDTTNDELEFGFDGGAAQLVVSDTGNVVTGTGALATSATNGFFYTPSMPGVPTGVPTSFTGRVPLAFNSASNTLYAYNSGWQALGGGGGGITGSGAAGRVTVWSGASSVTSDAEYLYDSGSNALSIGITPATAGTIRIPNAATITADAVGIGGTGAGNTNLIHLNASDFIQLGPTSSGTVSLDNPVGGDAIFQFRNSGGGNQNIQLEGYLSVYNSNEFASTVATAGTIRLPNANTIASKSVGVFGGTGAGNTNLIQLTGDDFIQLGPTSTGIVDIEVGVSGGQFRFRNGPGATAGNASVSIEGHLEVHSSNGFGTVASAGHIRLPNNATITADALGSGGTGAGNTNLVQLTGDDYIQFGPTSTGIIDIEAGVSNGQFRFRNGASATAGNASVSIEGHLEVHSTNGFGTVAGSGHIRLPNNASISADKALTVGDTNIIKLNASDYIQFGTTSTSVVDIDIASANGSFNFRDSAGGNANVNIEGYVSVFNSNEFAATSAATGNIRLPNLATMYGRNAANSADILMMRVNSSNQFETGVDIAVGGDFYDTTIPASVSATTLCIAGLGQIGTCTSDARLKTNVASLGSGLDIVEQLSPKTFDFINGQTGQSGFMAQDVQKLLPGLVTRNTGDDYLSLNYNGIVAYTVKAIQELNSQLVDLEVGVTANDRSIVLASIQVNDLVVHDSLVAENNLVVKRDLQIDGSILGSKHTRGIDTKVPEHATFYTVEELEFDEDQAYAVSITPSWITDFAVTKKTTSGFTVEFETPAPAEATFDYFIQR